MRLCITIVSLFFQEHFLWEAVPRVLAEYTGNRVDYVGKSIDLAENINADLNQDLGRSFFQQLWSSMQRSSFISALLKESSGRFSSLYSEF